MDNIFSIKDAPNIIADGIQDDYQALQNYLNNLPSGATLHFENYRVYCSQSISIDKPLLLIGNVLNTACITTNGNCIIINSSDVIIQNFAIGNNPRYSDSVNTNVGIKINGNAGSAIYLNNNIPNISCRGNKITNNDFLVYSDSYADRGVHQEGLESKYDLIQGNSFLNFRTFDIETAVGTYAIVANNFMLSDYNTISCYVSDDTKLSDNHTKGNVVVK